MKPECPKCKSEMFINEWEGWRYWCFACDIKGRRAIPAEIKEYEESKEITQ